MAGTEIDEEFLTVAEVAEVLKLNQQTVRNWIDQGSLPALRVGRRVRIKRSDFDRILEESYSGRATPSEGGPADSAAASGGSSAGAADPAAGAADTGAGAAGTAAGAAGAGNGPSAGGTGAPAGPSADAGPDAPSASGDQPTTDEPTPSAQDFWDGEPIGIPEPVPTRGAAP